MSSSWNSLSKKMKYVQYPEILTIRSRYLLGFFCESLNISALTILNIVWEPPESKYTFIAARNSISLELTIRWIVECYGKRIEQFSEDAIVTARAEVHYCNLEYRWRRSDLFNHDWCEIPEGFKFCFLSGICLWNFRHLAHDIYVLFQSTCEREYYSWENSILVVIKSFSHLLFSSGGYIIGLD